MPNPLDQLAQRIADLEDSLPELSRSSHLAYSSIDDGALTVTAGGKVRAVIGQQPDGTTGINVINGPTPPTPSAPTASPALGGVAASWDGTFARGAVCPLDFARVEVHAATRSTFTPSPATLVTTIESPQGGTATVPTGVPVWVVLLARSTSGTASAPSVSATAAPAKVVADEVLAGIVDELQLADDAVTAAKVATGAIDSQAIAAAAVTAAKLGQAAVVAGKIASDAVTAGTIAIDAITSREIAAGAITTSELAAGAVTTATLAAGAVTAGQIAAGTITATQLAANSIVSGKIAAEAVVAGKIAADSVTGREIRALSITADKIAANTITASKIAAGAITADALSVGLVNNYVPDGSFEGATGAALVAAAGPPWSIAPTGNASTKSAKVDATAAAPTTKSLALVTVPARPGDQLLLRYDYQASADWKGGAVKLYAQWLDATGATLGYNAAQSTTPVLGPTWQTLTATVTAPPSAISARLVLESWQATAGTVLFDNVEARPVFGPVQIADGTITAAKLSADAIDGRTITGVTVIGSTVQTGLTGRRVLLSPESPEGDNAPSVSFYSGDAREKVPAEITAYVAPNPAGIASVTKVTSPQLTDNGTHTPSVFLSAGSPANGYSPAGVWGLDATGGWTAGAANMYGTAGTGTDEFTEARVQTEVYRTDTNKPAVHILSPSSWKVQLADQVAAMYLSKSGLLVKALVGTVEVQSSAVQLTGCNLMLTHGARITTDDTWITPTFQNGCSQLAGWQKVQFKRLPHGFAALRGIVAIPAAMTGGVIFNISADSGCRPLVGEVFAGASATNVNANVFVYPSGDVVLTNAIGGLGGWLSFGSLQWSCVD